MDGLSGDGAEEVRRAGWGLSPMMLQVMAVGFIVLGWKLWPTDTDGEGEGDVEGEEVMAKDE